MRLNYLSFSIQATFPANAFAQLARLTHLTELELINFAVDFTLEAPIQPFPTVQSLCFGNILLRGEGPVELNFCHILSEMFPNLKKLNVDFNEKVGQ